MGDRIGTEEYMSDMEKLLAKIIAKNIDLFTFYSKMVGHSSARMTVMNENLKI